VNPDKTPPVEILGCDCASPEVHRGEILHVTLELKNHTAQAQPLFVWFDVTSPTRAPLTPYPYFKPVELRLQPMGSFRRDAYLLVPYSAGTDAYLLFLAVGPTPETRWDERSFEIVVLPQRESEKNRCNLCGEEVTEAGIIRRDPSIRLAECRSCGLVFDFDMRDTHSLLYELERVCEGGLAFQKNTPGILESYDRKNERVLGAEIRRIGKETGFRGKRLLDFGCGTGGLLNEARLAGFEVRGVETNEAAVAYASRHRGLPVFSSIGALRSQEGEQAFDVVVARHTLEHVANPMHTLREFRELLRPGGLLVIIVPHFNFFARSILPNSMPRFSYGLIHKGHQYYFTKATLARYLRESGFPEIGFRASLLGGFLSRWGLGAEASPKGRVLAGASASLSHLLHLAGLSPVLTAYAR
jgi:2-polyprenyl-3-methyl-5-hydroxy-6-metoxy-1,4-benzoquinol methylase